MMEETSQEGFLLPILTEQDELDLPSHRSHPRATISDNFRPPSVVKDKSSILVALVTISDNFRPPSVVKDKSSIPMVREIRQRTIPSSQSVPGDVNR